MSAHRIVIVAALLATGSEAAEFFVATNGDDSASGTSTAQPFRTVQKAVDVAQAGDAVYIRAGDYREQVQLRSSGTTSATISIEGYSNEYPSIVGSEPVTNWVSFTNAIWKVTNWVGNTQQVFVDAEPLRQIGWPNVYIKVNATIYIATNTTLGEMTNGTFYCDVTNRVLYVWLPDSSPPSGHNVEVAVRPLIVYPGFTNEYMSMKRLRFRHCNSSAISLTGLPGVGLGRHSVIEYCELQWMDAAAYSVAEHSQMLHCDVSHNGFLGLGWASCTNVRVAGCTVISNNYRLYNEYWNGAGIKVIPAFSGIGGGTAGGIIESNEVAWNFGFGVWFDSCTGRVPIIVRKNRIHHNGAVPGRGVAPSGVFMEVVKGATVENNLIVSNRGSGIWIAASDNVKVQHNTLIGNTGYNDIRVADIPRPIDEALGIWASLVSNEIINNVILNSECVFTIGLPFDNASPTNFCLGNRADYNCYYHTGGVYRFAVVAGTSWATFGEWTNLTTWDKHSINVNPLLASNGTPLAASPVVDAGTTNNSSGTDLTSTPRPLDGNNNGTPLPDMGALEYVHPTADTDGDSLSDSNEVATGTNPVRSDTDGDGAADGHERLAGTDPLDEDSVFAFNKMDRDAGLIVRWSSVSGRNYAVAGGTNLSLAFSYLATNLPASPPVNAYTDDAFNAGARFYRIETGP
ncbi:MAG TPA: right-handed parallel beta-helix repeat-containing protein [Kiritimatiellia bacterium]